MKFKQKQWLWKLTFPFAHSNYTTIWETIYHPKGRLPSQLIIEHEMIHSSQQKKHGKLLLPLWIWLYLVGIPLGLPFLWNPWRWKWEHEAYVKGSRFSDEFTRKLLRSKSYGWLILNG